MSDGTEVGPREPPTQHRRAYEEFESEERASTGSADSSNDTGQPSSSRAKRDAERDHELDDGDDEGSGPLSTAAESSVSSESTDQPPSARSASEGAPATPLSTDLGSTDSVESGGTTSPGLQPGMDVDDLMEDDGGLFDDLLSGEPIFERKEILRPAYTPNELPHRTEQINEMATILLSALRGESPSNILIYGKTGTGKTASAKYVSQELEETSERLKAEADSDVPCEVQYINCEVTDTQYRVLAQLANQFIDDNERRMDAELEELRSLRDAATADPSALDDTPHDDLQDVDAAIDDLEAERAALESVPMTGWPTDRVYSTFFDAVDRYERVVLIMLDEIDKLVEKSGDDTLYNLSRMNSALENSRVSIIGISNDLKFTDFLDPRVKSSLGEEEIVFPPYDAPQLRDILEQRSQSAFKPDSLTEDVIPLCAAFAAREHGDARRALDLLRTAGELAERTGATSVDEDHVRQAQEKIELDRVVEVVRTLPTQSKTVLYAIILPEKRGDGPVHTGEVYNIYSQLCDEIGLDELTQRRVTDLISELDMLGIVNAVVVSKGRYGRTKEISLSVPVEETETVLRSDSRLEEVGTPSVQTRLGE